MHHSRLVGGLVALAALLTLSVVPVAVATGGGSAATDPGPVTASAAVTGVSRATPTPSSTVAALPPANPGALTRARACLGVPYLAGGSTRAGFDAQGLTRYVYWRLGVWLPKDISRQAGRGVEITREQLQPGDLVFLGAGYEHVGIYAGDDSMIDVTETNRVVAFSTIDWSDVVSLRRYDSRTGYHAALIARRQLGVPYVWGGVDRGGFDCSGLMLYVYAKLGVSLAHEATSQQVASTPIALGNLRRGDLVFWGNSKWSYHVGIYMGNGRVIHAPHAGAVVSYGTIDGAWIGGRFLRVR